MEEVPGIWIDRAGVKATLSQNFSRQSRSSSSVILEEITSRDDSGAICAHGVKQEAVCGLEEDQTFCAQVSAETEPTPISCDEALSFFCSDARDEGGREGDANGMGIAKYEFEARNIEVDKDAGPLRSGASESTGFLNGLDHLKITSPSKGCT